jgi:hypothetical protein
VVQRRCRFRFTDEAFGAVGVGGRFGPKHLQRHDAIEPGVEGAKHLPHSAAAERLEHAIMRDLTSNHGVAQFITAGAARNLLSRHGLPQSRQPLRGSRMAGIENLLRGNLGPVEDSAPAGARC